MSYIRTVKKENPFVQLDKEFIGNGELSLKATGLLTYFLSKPSDWKIRTQDVQKRFKDGRESISNGIKELVAAGYVHYYQERIENGQLGQWVYEVYERPEFNPNVKPLGAEEVQPQTGNPSTAENAAVEGSKPKTGFPNTGKPKTGFPKTGKPKTGNPSRTNNELSNNDLTNNELNNSSSSNKEEEKKTEEKKQPLLNEDPVLNEFLYLSNSGIMVKERDRKAAEEIKEAGVPADEAIKYLREVFEKHERTKKHSRDTISTLNYCVGHILDQHSEKKRGKNRISWQQPQEKPQDFWTEQQNKEMEEKW